MSARNPRALVLDPDPRALSDVAAALSPGGFRIAARTSPEDSLDFARRARPDLVVLGRPFWDQGWGAKIHAVSPASVIIPASERSRSGAA